jgi:Na+/citrate or Na+/malate symporter
MAEESMNDIPPEPPIPPPWSNWSIFAGGIAGLGLLIVYRITVLRHDIFWKEVIPEDILIGTIIFAVLATAGGGLLGYLGERQPITGRATGVGAVVMALLASTATMISLTNTQDLHLLHTIHEGLQHIREEIWGLATVLSSMSITSSVGAICGGKIIDDRRVFQFSLGEMFFIFLPFAVLFGYVSQFH